MGGGGGGSPWLPLLYILIPAIVVVVIMSRRMRPRPLNVARMWILPAILALAIVSLIQASLPPLTIVTVPAFAAALAIGAAIGWWRGRLTRMSIDPATRVITVQMSAFGAMILIAIMAARMGLRTMLNHYAPTLHIDPLVVTDAFLVLAWGLVTAQRAELWFRSRRLLAETAPAPHATEA